MSGLLAALCVTLPALVVLWRVARVLSHLSRRQFKSIATFDGFARLLDAGGRHAGRSDRSLDRRRH